MAKHVYTYIDPTSKRDLDEACGILANHGVIAYPTDVNWAFGCDAASSQAMAKIRLLKPHHPKEQPFSLLCGSVSMVAAVAYIENFAYRLIKKVLPGPYTFIMKRTHDLPRQIKDKRKLVGIRVPDSPLLLDLVNLYEKPIATTSLPILVGQDPITFGYEIEEKYGHGIDLILDLGEQLFPAETNIIDLSEGQVRIVRRGVGDLTIFERLGVDLS